MDNKIEHHKVGGYQCPQCYLRSGDGWIDKPSSPPTCCGGVPMVPYVIPSPNQEEDATTIALEAITEAVSILYSLSRVTNDRYWMTDSVYIANLDKLARALGFSNALAVQEQVVGDRQHAAAKRRDAGW